MNVGDLKRALSFYSDDVTVMARPSNAEHRRDWISVSGGTGLANREDTAVAAFVLDLAMTIPGPIERVEVETQRTVRITARGFSDPQGFVPSEIFAWWATAADDAQAMANHGQTIERLHERGGVSWCELSAILEHRPHRATEFQRETRARCLRVKESRLRHIHVGPGDECGRCGQDIRSAVHKRVGES